LTEKAETAYMHQNLSNAELPVHGYGFSDTNVQV